MGTKSTPSETPRPRTVTVTLDALQTSSIPLTTLEEAFGPDSLGIILVSDLPSNFSQLRAKLLSSASYLANLPASELAKLERPQTRYNIGWSHGREKLDSGKFDTAKGSFYVQPVQDKELERRAREYAPDLLDMVSENVWPDPSILPGFEATVREMCDLIISVASLVAKNVDRFGEEQVEGYGKGGVLEAIVKGSVSTKARLLHYFPQQDSPTPSSDEERAVKDDWCGTHTDLGALTGLLSNMFVDEAAHPPQLPSDGEAPPNLPEMDSHPDPGAGLWIQDRAGRLTQVDIPRDCLAFQTGQALERLTKGKFRAVPHFVRGGKAKGGSRRIARNTLAVFTQPNLWEVVDKEKGLDFAGLAREVFGRTY